MSDPHAARIALALAFDSPPPTRQGLLTPVERIADAAVRQGIGAETRAGAIGLGWQALSDALACATRGLAFAGMKNLGMTKRISDILATAGVESLVLKGVALAAMTREVPTTRPSGDVDLLIRPDDVMAAHAVLAGNGAVLGQRSAIPENTAAYRVYLRLRHEDSYILGGTNVDLHWHLGPERSLLPSTREAFRDAVTVEALGIPLRTLSVPHALTHSSVHWRGSRYRGLKYVLDLLRLRAQLPAELDLAHRVRHAILVAWSLAASDAKWIPNSDVMSRDVGYREAVRQIADARSGLQVYLGERLYSAYRGVRSAPDMRSLASYPAFVAAGPVVRWRQDR